MQDYFKYDKIQGGAPLRMKSDSDGVTDGQDSVTPLGIKTTAQGIKHFTNWDDISNSLDAQNKARFDDTQPNALRFSMNNARGAFKSVAGGVYPIFKHSGDNANDNPYYKRRQSRVEFEDRWDAEDITILDDMAFVSYPDYTDLHRADLSLQDGGLQLQQVAHFNDSSETQTVHSTLRFTTNLGRLQQVLSFGSTTQTALRSLDFTSLDNTILKIRFTKGADGRLSYNDGANQFSDQPSGDTSTTSTPEVLYFVYGGVLPEEGVPGVAPPDAPTGMPYLDETNTQFDHATITSSSDQSPLQDINGDAISGANNKQVVGRFYLVPLGETNDGYHIPVENTVGIQLDITSRWAEDLLDMGSATLKPNADHTIFTHYPWYKQDDSTTDKFAAINNGVSSPEDGEYLTNGSFGSTSNTGVLSLGFEDMPVDFISMTAVSLKIREKCGDDAVACGVKYQIFDEDGDALTNEINKAHNLVGEQYFFEDWTDRTLDFTINSSDETSWNGARLRIIHYDADGADTIYFISELELEVEYEIFDAGVKNANYKARKELFTGNASASLDYRAYSVGMEEVTLIKVQPVRKCGKVDIYTRKKGIIDAIVGNAATSPIHTLNTNDVIEISSALFDGSQAGYADIHPLNGKKFVRKMDDDTFEIFDDQYFLDRTDTSFLKSTMGINWICISSNYGAIGQSWDYHGTIFSPTGRNGYLSGNINALENSLSDPAQFFTEKRIDSLFATVPSSNIAGAYPTGSRTSGVVNIDFRNSFNNPDFAQIIDESVPERFSYESPFSNFQYGPQDFYPYHCSNLAGQPVLGVDSDTVKSRESSEASSYTTTPYTGCRFGSSLDIKFSHIDGDSKVYTLAVGERGSDLSVDLFGVEESECHIDTYGVDDGSDSDINAHGRARHYNSIVVDGVPILTENFRKRIIPWYLPYGKTHILAITVDRYGRISDVSHMNSLFGGGDEILVGSSSTALIDHREANPWKDFEKAERSFYIEEDVDALLDSEPPASVLERYTQSTTIADPDTDDNFQIESRNPDPYIEPATGANLATTLTSGADDPFVAITEGRGVTVGDGLTYHSLESWGVSRYSANTIDNNRGFVTSAVMSARLSRGWPFSHDEDDLDSHKFKFSIVSADEATAYTDVFMPTVVSDEDSLSSINVQGFASDELITVAGQAASLQDWSKAKIKLDVLTSIVCDTEEKRLAGTYKMHEFSVDLSISEISVSQTANLDTPISVRTYRSDDLFSEPSYWIDVNSRYTTKYWLRAAALHWYPQDIYEYNYNMTPSDTLMSPSQIPRVRSFNTGSYTARLPSQASKILPIIRRDVTYTIVGSTSPLSMCRFGYSGFTSMPCRPNFYDINRFSRNPTASIVNSSATTGPLAINNDISNNSQWYIFPWVDSFGKSVALQHTKDGTYVLSGCRSRANEELNAGYQDIQGLNPVPLQPSNPSSERYSLPELVESDTKSRIGHINIAQLRKRVLFMQTFNELNSGGTVFTLNFVGGNALETPDPATGTSQVPVKYLQLPVGTDAGLGMPEVINSAELSNSHIVWKDDYILFSEQNLYNVKSLLHVFKYDSTNGFTGDDKISVPFIDGSRGAGGHSWAPRHVCPAYNVGDGFGLHFRYDKDLLVSNCMQSVDQLGDDITTKMFASDLSLSGQQSGNPSRIDALSVYERRLRGGRNSGRILKFVQNIYPSIDANDQEQYPRSLITGLRHAPFSTDYNYKYLVPLHTLTYDNTVADPWAWNINWTGRYDVVGTKIIIKDPLEYSLYSSTFTDRYADPTSYATPASVSLSPYLTFTEYVEAKTDSLSSFAKYTYDDVSEFTSSDSCGGGDTVWVGRDKSITKTPVMFFNVPLGNLDMLDSLTITFNISNQISREHIRTSLSTSGVDDDSDLLIPRIVLYKKDPRSTIILNGPSDTGSRSTYFPHYKNGIFKTILRATKDDMDKARGSFGGIAASTYFNISNLPTVNQYGPYSEQHQAFFRGGAADLFFYGTLPASIVDSAQQNIDSIKAVGHSKMSLPFYYGGGKNLGEYFDLSYGSHGSAGLPTWISNDTLDSPFLQDNKLGFSIKDNTTSPLIFSSENLALIEPYAKLFKPTMQTGTSVSITISAAELRDFVIDGNLLKSSTDDRAVFGNRPAGTEYPQIYNDTLASPGFDDVNKASYESLDNMQKTIAIGFVMTNVNSHTIGSDPIADELGLFDAPDQNIDNNPPATDFYGLRTINRGYADASDPITGVKRYPYSAVANDYGQTYTFNGNPTFGNHNIKTTRALLDFDFSTDISNIIVNANIRSVQPIKYSNKFHKIAIFDYHQESSNDIKSSTKYKPDGAGVNPDGSIGFSDTQFIEPFAHSKFSPLTVGLSNAAHNLNSSRFGEYNFNFVAGAGNTSTFNTQYHGILQSENSIVRFSNTSNAPLNGGAMISSTTMQDSPGSYAKSIQILNSENLNYNDSSYYVNVDDNTPTFILPPTGHILGEALFSRASLLGGFDIYDPEFVPLFVGGIIEREKYSYLFAEGMVPVNDDAPLKMVGEEMLTGDIPLKIGIAFASGLTPLFTYAPEVNQLSLFTFEIPPSAVIPLTVSGPDATAGLSLVTKPPTKGFSPLFTQGPTQSTDGISLWSRGYADHNLFTSMFMPTFGVDTGNPSLYIEHGVPDESQIPLTFSPGSSGAPPLFIKVPEPSTNSTDLFLEVADSSNLGTSLYVKPIGYASGLPSLFTKGPISFDANIPLIASRGYYPDAMSSLYIDTVRPMDSNTDLFTSSYIYTVNSNNDGSSGEFVLRYRNGLLLNGEQAVAKTISNVDDANTVHEISSNSITYPTLFNIDGVNSSIRFPEELDGGYEPRNNYMGTHDKRLSHTTNVGAPSTFDPIYNMKLLQTNSSRLKAWINDLSTMRNLIDHPRHVVRDDMFDSNGKYVVVASQGHIFSGSDTGGLIAIYKVNSNGSLDFDTRLNTVYFDFKLASAGTDVLGTVGGVDIVDGFYSLRQELYDHLGGIPAYSHLNYNNSTKVRILDIAISKQNKCAISLRGYFGSASGYSLGYDPLDIIIEFDILDYISSEQGFATNQVTAIFRTADDGWASSIPSYQGTSLSYCGEKLYFNWTRKNLTIFDNEYILVKNFTNSIEVIKFGAAIPDAQLYMKNAARLIYYENFTGFGYVIKCFDRYETNDKIIFVSAPLFDPYLNNTLTSAYRVNPMGAVYIFNQSLGSNAWIYQGAVYAKGFTSDNILSNLDQYKNGQLHGEFALFGYDLDYKQDVLVVSEPGGNSTGTTNDASAGRCYRFDVTDPAVPILLNTYKASDLRSDPVDAASAAIDVNDNFASSVVLLNRRDVITWSDANIQKEVTQTGAGTMTVFKNDSTLYNLNTGRYYGFQDDAGENYDNNIYNEVKQYFPVKMLEITPAEISVSSRILVMKELKFGDSTKLGVLREFSVKTPLNDAAPFKIHKLSIIEPDKIAGLTLFIKGPTRAVSDMPLVTESIGLTNAESTLIIPGHFDTDSSHSLYLAQKRVENNIPLHIRGPAAIFSPLYQLGGVVPADNDTRLVISVPNMESDTSLHTYGVEPYVLSTALKIGGSLEPEDVIFAPLFIGKDIHKNNFANLFTHNLYTSPPPPDGRTVFGTSHNTSIAISGGLFYNATTRPGLSLLVALPDSASGVLTSPLYITTDIPPTGEGGQFLHNANINLVLPVDETIVPAALGNKLFIKQRATKTETTNLYIERNLPVITTVFMSGVGVGTGIMPLSIEATHVDNEDISLIIKPVPELGMNLTSRGFVE